MILDDWSDLSAAFSYHIEAEQQVSPDDVASVHREWTDGVDEPSFAWVVLLTSGKWAAVVGSHDYTGWDCQSSASLHVADSFEHAVQLCGDDPRRAWEESDVRLRFTVRQSELLQAALDNVPGMDGDDLETLRQYVKHACEVRQ